MQLLDLYFELLFLFLVLCLQSKNLIVGLSGNSPIGDAFSCTDVYVGFQFLDLLIHLLDRLKSKHYLFTHHVNLNFEMGIITDSIIKPNFFVFEEGMRMQSTNFFQVLLFLGRDHFLDLSGIQIVDSLFLFVLVFQNQESPIKC